MRLFINLWHMVERINRILYRFGSYFIIILCSITVVDVVGRYLFNQPLSGNLELSELCMVTIIFLAFGFSFTEGAHIKVDFFTKMLSERKQTFAEALTYVLTLLFLIIMAWQTAKMALDMPSSHTDVLKIPTVPFELLVPLGCILACISLIGHIASAIKRFLKP